MTLAVGARLGPYEILGQLGAGGMGEVYRARDPKLRREVAIKVLPEALAENADALARFEREAFAIGALSHPNILAIFDFGQDRGVSYAVMELLKGGTMRDLLNAGPIPVKQAVALALQIAKGLSAAHEHGIVHRDLKPENLFVGPDGHLKILDFGLAMKTELARSEAETTLSSELLLTRTGAVMGTVPDMLPEQVRGQRVDHRSDLFSFGAIFYEILSGSRAFKSDSPAETLSAILRDEPPPLSDSGREISPALTNIVRHCLEKNTEQRFQSARDVAFALEELLPQVGVPSAPSPRRQRKQVRWRWPAAAILAVVALVAGSLIFLLRDQPIPKQPRAKRIVVLPFENLGAPEDAYFALGLAEEIINRLANVRGLAVISRTTAVAYDRKGKTARQIGADLGVDYVLEGTVRSERVAGQSSRLRISPQLVQVSDDTNVWADRFDRVLAEVIVIQSEVAESVVRAMGIQLLPREETALRAVATRDIEAYDLYLRGREISSRGQTREYLEGAIRAYQSAVDRDPHFSEALAQLTRAHLYLYFVIDPSQEHIEKARDAIERLEAIDPGLPETHLARGYYAYWVELDYPRALQEFSELIALQPSNADPLEGISYVLRRQGRFSESTDQISKWLDLDPRNSLALFQFGLSASLAGRYEEAERAYTQSSAINPQFGIPWANRGLLQITWKGDMAGAESLLAKARKVPGVQDGTGELALAFFRSATLRREPQDALRQLEEQKGEVLSNQHYTLPVDLLRGQAYALLGNSDLAHDAYAAARKLLEQRISEQPNDFRCYGSLGVAYAGLGMRAQALQAALRGTELMPPSKDAFRALWPLEQLAEVETMVGRQDEAIAGLESLLLRARRMSTHWLRLDPRWDPLRENPKFQALLEKYETR